MSQINDEMSETVTVPTHAGTVLGRRDRKSDASAKEIMKDKQIAALILREAFPSDFKEYTIRYIAGRIDSVTVLNPDEKEQVPGKMAGSDTEDQDESGLIRFDVRFTWNGETGHMLVNLEMQRKYTTEYAFSRMLYYISRMISSQKHIEFQGIKYQNLAPIRQVWIFPDWTGASDVIDFSLQAESRLGFADREEMQKLRKLGTDSFVSCFVFLNERDYDESRYRMSLIQTMGEVFQNNERDQAIAWLEKEKEIRMSQELRQAMLDYRFYPNVTHEELSMRLKEKDKTIEEKDRTIEEKDRAIEEKDKAIEELSKEIERLKKANFGK